MEVHDFEINKHQKLLICYGSERGYAKSISETLYNKLSLLCKDIKEANNLEDISLLNTYDIIIFVFSTCLNGKFPKNSQKFWSNIKKYKGEFNFKYCILGIGDISYVDYCLPAINLSSKLSMYNNCSTIHNLTLLDDSIDHDYQLIEWIKNVSFEIKYQEKQIKKWFSNSMTTN